MLARRKKIGAPQQVQVGLWMIAPDLFANFFDSDHKVCALFLVLCASCLGWIELVGVFRRQSVKPQVQRTKYLADYNKIGDARPVSLRHLFKVGITISGARRRSIVVRESARLLPPLPSCAVPRRGR